MRAIMILRAIARGRGFEETSVCAVLEPVRAWLGHLNCFADVTGLSKCAVLCGARDLSIIMTSCGGLPFCMLNYIYTFMIVPIWHENENENCNNSLSRLETNDYVNIINSFNEVLSVMVQNRYFPNNHVLL